MYYYLKLSSLSNTSSGIAVLSCLINGMAKQELAEKLKLSDRQIRRIFKDLESTGVINKDMQVVAELPHNYQFPYVYVTGVLIKKMGLNRALYLSYQRSWNGGSIQTDLVSSKLLGLSKRSSTRFRLELSKEHIIKEGRLDTDRYEDVFTVKATAQQKNLGKARKKMKADLKYKDIAWIFKVLCAEHGYSKIPPPLKSDIAKAMAIQKTLERAESSVTLGELMERLVMRWMGLWGNRPTMPSLRFLPVYYHDLFDPDDKGATTIITTPKQWTPSASDQELRQKTEEEYIDEYNERIADDGMVGD